MLTPNEPVIINLHRKIIIYFYPFSCCKEQCLTLNSHLSVHFYSFLIPALFYCYKRKLPRIRREKWIWTFFYCFFFNIFNVTNYLAVNYIAAGVASCIRRFVKTDLPNLFEVFVNNTTMPMLTYLSTLCFSYVYVRFQPLV